MNAGPAYRYSATVRRIHDGDSLTLDLDLGFKVWLRDVAIRLAGCNARELADLGGVAARDHLAGVVPVGSPVTMLSLGPDKYGGRWDARLFLPDGTDVVALLCQNEWAAPWNGKGAKPVPPWPRQVGA